MNTFITTTILCILVLLETNMIPSCQAQLSPTFYDTTCPKATSIIRDSIRRAVSRERRMAASLVRLHFHDCFVQGCDASILLDEAPTIESEQTAFPNLNSVRGFQVIEDAKREVERVCPGVVSCADILTLAARDASVAVGATSWNVRLGRRDSTNASRTQAKSDLPGPGSSLDSLIRLFSNKGLSPTDLVALSGAHTMGQARCLFYRGRIYSNGTDIDPGFASKRRRSCPQVSGDTNLAPLDLVTPNSFDNNYFKNLMQRKGLFQSDQVLLSAPPTNDIVLSYSENPQLFAAEFAISMIKMSEIDPLLGQNGIIRRVCSAVN